MLVFESFFCCDLKLLAQFFVLTGRNKKFISKSMINVPDAIACVDAHPDWD